MELYDFLFLFTVQSFILSLHFRHLNQIGWQIERSEHASATIGAKFSPYPRQLYAIGTDHLCLVHPRCDRAQTGSAGQWSAHSSKYER